MTPGGAGHCVVCELSHWSGLSHYTGPSPALPNCKSRQGVSPGIHSITDLHHCSLQGKKWKHWHSILILEGTLTRPSYPCGHLVIPASCSGQYGIIVWELPNPSGPLTIYGNLWEIWDLIMTPFFNLTLKVLCQNLFCIHVKFKQYTQRYVMYIWGEWKGQDSCFLCSFDFSPHFSN